MADVHERRNVSVFFTDVLRQPLLALHESVPGEDRQPPLLKDPEKAIHVLGGSLTLGEDLPHRDNRLLFECQANCEPKRRREIDRSQSLGLQLGNLVHRARR